VSMRKPRHPGPPDCVLDEREGRKEAWSQGGPTSKNPVRGFECQASEPMIAKPLSYQAHW